MIQPVLDIGDNLVSLGSVGGHLYALHHGPAVGHGIGLGVKKVDVEALLGLGVMLIEVVPGLKGVAEGGGTLGVDGDVNEVSIPLGPGALKALGEYVGVELGVGGNLGGGQEHIKKLIGGEVYAVLIFLVTHGNGEGEYLDGILIPQLCGQVCGGVGGEFDTSHR